MLVTPEIIYHLFNSGSRVQQNAYWPNFSQKNWCGKRKHGVYVRRPDDFKATRSQCKTVFGSWKQDQFSDHSIVHDNYHTKRKYYCLAVCNFLNQIEIDNVIKLSVAVETDKTCFAGS